MSRSLYENHWGSPTLTLLNVLGVLGVLNMLNVLNVLNVLYVLNVLHVLHVLHGRIVGLLGLVSINCRSERAISPVGATVGRRAERKLVRESGLGILKGCRLFHTFSSRKLTSALGGVGVGGGGAKALHPLLFNNVSFPSPNPWGQSM